MAISTNAHVQAKCEAEGGRANVFLEMFLAEVAEFTQHTDNDRWLGWLVKRYTENGKRTAKRHKQYRKTETYGRGQCIGLFVKTEVSQICRIYPYTPKDQSKLRCRFNRKLVGFSSRNFVVFVEDVDR